MMIDNLLGTKMLFEQSFLETIVDNPVGSIVSACDKTIGIIHELTRGFESEDLLYLMETAVLVSEIIDNYSLKSDNHIPEISGNLEHNCQALFQYLKNVQGEFQVHAYEIQFESIKSRYKSALNINFNYEFTQGDIDRIQTLINELRGHISNSSELENSHQQRLLKRLEKLQSELHKRVSDLDRFWGMVGDAGVVLGKLGSDAKPIVDRVREIADIVWRTQARAEELPSGTKLPLLENDPD